MRPPTVSVLLASLRRESSDDELRTVIEAIRTECPADSETAATLAEILAASGRRISPPGDFVADVASTGGPGSLSTLLAPLYLRSAGAVVPKLGVPGRPAGGIDCLAQIPGYRTVLSERAVSEILLSGGYSHFLATGETAPLDGRMFRLRQTTDAQSVPTLVIASLLAKKIAVGVRYAGLDVRVAAHGNFGPDWRTAVANCLLFIEAARRLGIEAVPVLTDANHPYQPYLGRRESLLAMHNFFDRSADGWLGAHVSACRALALACCPDSRRKLAAAADPAELRAHFERNLRDQGAHPDAFVRVAAATRNGHVVTLLAERDGFCHFPMGELRDDMVKWQEQGVSTAEPFPDPVGLIFLKRPGEWVEHGTPVATARIESGDRGMIAERLRALVCFPGPRPCAPGLEAVHG